MNAKQEQALKDYRVAMDKHERLEAERREIRNRNEREARINLRAEGYSPSRREVETLARQVPELRGANSASARAYREVQRAHRRCNEVGLFAEWVGGKYQWVVK